MSREGLRVREVSNDEGNRLLRMVRRSSGSVVTWRRAQMVLLSVQGMDVAQIAKVTFTSPDRVREVINNFNEDGFDRKLSDFNRQHARGVATDISRFFGERHATDSGAPGRPRLNLNDDFAA